MGDYCWKGESKVLKQCKTLVGQFNGQRRSSCTLTGDFPRETWLQVNIKRKLHFLFGCFDAVGRDHPVLGVEDARRKAQDLTRRESIIRDTCRVQKASRLPGVTGGPVAPQLPAAALPRPPEEAPPVRLFRGPPGFPHSSSIPSNARARTHTHEGLLKTPSLSLHAVVVSSSPSSVLLPHLASRHLAALRPAPSGSAALGNRSGSREVCQSSSPTTWRGRSRCSRASARSHPWAAGSATRPQPSPAGSVERAQPKRNSPDASPNPSFIMGWFVFFVSFSSSSLPSSPSPSPRSLN